jgi:hypothetical protein
MTSINDKLGIKRAGQRAMMRLPADRALRNRVTAARCPVCGRTGAHLAQGRGRAGWLVCGWCAHTWELPA